MSQIRRIAEGGRLWSTGAETVAPDSFDSCFMEDSSTQEGASLPSANTDLTAGGGPDQLPRLSFLHDSDELRKAQHHVHAWLSVCEAKSSAECGGKDFLYTVLFRRCPGRHNQWETMGASEGCRC